MGHLLLCLISSIAVPRRTASGSASLIQVIYTAGTFGTPLFFFIYCE